MRLRWFEDMDEDENRPYDMEEPNFFGLSIAYDPYMREVVQADRLTTCGGDGGCNICGGLGPFLGFLFRMEFSIQPIRTSNTGIG